MVDLISLEELVKKNPILFSDTNVLREKEGWYRNGVARAQNFREVDCRLVQDGLAYFDWLQAWFSLPAVLTTKKVVAELKRFYSVIEKHKRALWRERVHSESGRIVLFHRLISSYKQVIRAAERAVFEPLEREKVNALEKIAVLVGEHTDAKRSYRYRYENQKQARDMHTDESLVAAAFSVSLRDLEPCVIVTSDSDIGRLTEKMHYFLTNKDMQYGNDMSEALHYNPVRVYFVVGDNMVSCAADTSRRTQEGQFRLGLPNAELARVKQQVEKYAAIVAGRKVQA